MHPFHAQRPALASLYHGLRVFCFHLLRLLLLSHQQRCLGCGAWLSLQIHWCLRGCIRIRALACWHGVGHPNLRITDGSCVAASLLLLSLFFGQLFPRTVPTRGTAQWNSLPRPVTLTLRYFLSAETLQRSPLSSLPSKPPPQLPVSTANDASPLPRAALDFPNQPRCPYGRELVQSHRDRLQGLRGPRPLPRQYCEGLRARAKEI